jgi:hypothetical protein
LNIMWEACDVFIYILGCCLISSHIFPSSYPETF